MKASPATPTRRSGQLHGTRAWIVQQVDARAVSMIYRSTLLGLFRAVRSGTAMLTPRLEMDSLRRIERS
jgi:hypothetical protein